MADVQEAVEFLRETVTAESVNRSNALEALQFRYGDQWPQYAIASRGLDRPQLTINETNTYIKRIANQQRQQRPRGKASPVDDIADPKIAKVITGLGRHVEVQSDADNAYDTAFDFAATMGWGYWRLRHDYIAPDSFNQDIFIDVVDNPFTVYFDPNSRLPDGSDAEKALITDTMSKKAFEREYPGAQMANFSEQGGGDSNPDWITEYDIRLAEYFHLLRIPAKLIMLDDGQVMWADQFRANINSAVMVVKERPSKRTTVQWQKQTAFEVLERQVLPGRFIPVIPVYATNVVIDGKRWRYGLVKDAMDPQRMVNFWNTAATESIALAPKAKWLIAEGQDEGFENDFKNANLSPNPVLRYKQTDVNGQPAPPPERLQPEPPPAGIIEAMFTANQNLSRVMGIYDPAVRGGAQHKSDKTLNAEQNQSENSNFDIYDNLTRSIKHTWRIMLSWFPVIYDTAQVKRIIGEDGREEMVEINTPNSDGAAINAVMNDVRVGTYDVVMQTGPGYDTRRKEGVAAILELLGTPVGEKVAAVADDVLVRQMDFTGADVVADRLAAANPLSQIDEKLDIPPQAQMKILAQGQQIQQLTQQLQQAGIEIKFGLQKEQMKQTGETQRAHLAAAVKAHDVNERNLSMQHSTEVKAQAALSVAEIHAMAALMGKKIDVHQLEVLKREIEEEEAEQTAKFNENASEQA